MRPKLSKDVDEVCYPFMSEKSLKCDFEILTDELCRQVGGILAEMPEDFPEVVAELEALQPLIYHLNRARGEPEIPFESQTYRARKPRKG